jgi:hypothetical protein
MLPQCIIFFSFLVLDQGTSYRRSCRRNFEKDSFDWKFKWLMPFLIVKSDWKATNTPSTTTISPNTSNQSFEISILFSVVYFTASEKRQKYKCFDREDGWVNVSWNIYIFLLFTSCALRCFSWLFYALLCLPSIVSEINEITKGSENYIWLLN